jgi:hypothetical protein
MRLDGNLDDQAQLLSQRLQPEGHFEAASPTHIPRVTWLHSWGSILEKPTKTIRIDKKTIKDVWLLSSQAQVWPAWGLVGLAAVNAFLVAQGAPLP